jgi:glycerophosphoryl diester phosphodiesterase
VRALRPDIPTALVVGPDGDVGAALREAVHLRHRALHPTAELVDRALVERARSLGLELHAWTVNDPDEVSRLAKLGIDGVITDVPDVALAMLMRVA